MSSTNKAGVIQVRLEPELKRAAEQLFSDMGLDAPTAIRLFLKQSLIQKRIPFSIVQNPETAKSPMARTFTTEELEALMEHSITKSLIGAIPHPDISPEAI
jgi:addiction module RelB/DinJ family antitoxin